MASFSEIYYSNGTLLGRCTNSVKYLLDPEARARRIVNISQHADISFCQAFWFLSESGKKQGNILKIFCIHEYQIFHFLRPVFHDVKIHSRTERINEQTNHSERMKRMTFF